MSGPEMKIKTAKAAVLVESRHPLIVDDIIFPDELDVGQVLVKILYTTICGAQINEIQAVKGPDKFLPHLLGHEASGSVIETGPGDHCQAGGYCCPALASKSRNPEFDAIVQMAR
jgi:threonine dehydrogenase-like Zn-dependent dehydrogenase